ncbi:uncharacterized protein LOC122713359 [Apis laboriosa]|uniref:uncharacterized protein LOC122713359 n=1 Tax=Apis laboriosa TaxID=183418 RepID=UPI001CC57A8C|nr:uncharacterized protein LOC122713359 [Apis laboriosa]
MSSSIRSNAIWLFLFLCATVTICQDVEQTSEIPEDSEDESSIWMEYEFGTGAGNREELIVTNISVREYTNVPKTARNWQFLEVNGTGYLFRNERSTLFYNKLDLDKGTIDELTKLIVKGTILKFKAIEMKSNIVIVLCVQLNIGILLECYTLLDGNSFRYLGSLPVLKHVKDMEIITKLSDNQDTYKIFVLNEEDFFLQMQNSIDVYGFDIDFSTNGLNFWFYYSTYVPRSFDIQVINIYETVSLVLRGENDVFLYEYRNMMEGNDILERQTIKSYNLNNFICFESGYLQFLSISGPEAGLFLFEDGEFQFNTESESSFDVSDISWVTSVQLATYRDESMLLVQLKNMTVFALGWQGSSYKKVQLPNNDLDRFDLSMITPIPKYGFIAGNRVVKFDTQLKSVKHPLQYETEKLVRLQKSLNELIEYEERIINETKARLKESKIENPVITGFWNISGVNATNVIISDNVTFESITLGETKLTKEDLKFDVNNFEMKLREAERKLEQIDSRLNGTESNDFVSNLRFDSDVEINGDIYVKGSLYTDNLTVSSINGIDATLPSNNYTIDFKDVKNLTINSINGIPVENIRFGDSIVDYSGVDFDKISRAEILGDLSFSTINGLDWETLMKNIVWKDRDMLIPGETVIEGTVTSNNVELSTLNGLLYPEQYVLENGNSPYVTVTGSKTFESFEALELENATTLNGIDFDDYVILSKENVLNEGISFENLTVTDELILDCEIEGLNMEERLLLNETTKISSDILFYNLNVSGNVTFDRLIINNTEVDLGDLLLRTDENVVITGTKTFLKNVEMRSNVTITSGMINGHHVDEFVTLDTDQVFPNLRKISANVTFGNVTFGAIKKLEKFFRENNSTGCLNRTVIFESPVTVEQLTFDKLNNNVSYEFFTRKVNETFGNASFENLTVDTLIADEIVANTVNDLDLVDYAKHLESSDIECTIDDALETDRLCAKSVNGMPAEEIGQLKDRLSAMLDHVQSGNLTLNSLRVIGTIKADSINGERVTDLYNEERFGPRPVIVKDEVYIDDLTILGLMNGYNFTERVLDTVQKSDPNIVIEGHKTFDSIICTELDAKYLNGRPIENILDPYKEQVLSGPVIVNGTMTVSEYFDSTGNINGVPYRELTDKFRYLGNNSYEIRGDVRFLDDVTIENLYVNGSIQGIDFDDFLNTVIYKDEDNVTVSGTKIFEDTVTFNDEFFVHEKLNDIDLRRFREKAVFIDAPFSVKSKIIFKDGIKVEKNIVVKKSLEAKSIMGIDIDELRSNVLYLNRPSYVDANLTFTNVIFESNVEVKKINDVDMDLLIPLKTDQFIPVKVLRGYNITAENIEILGTVNGVDLREMQEKTFMLTGDQNITGHFTFHGVVHFRNEFNPRLINGINPNRFIPLNTKSTIVGNFVFEKPVILNKSLRLLGYLNGIDVNRWEAVAVTTENSVPQFISGNWTVLGNVYFQNGAYGSEILNGTNVTEVSSILAKKHLEMDAMLEEKSANLDAMCKDLAELKRYAENQIYQFNAFDYLQIIEFDSGSIASVHYFETNDTDHLILSCNDCQMHAYAFTEEKFESVGDMANFGVVEEWATFERDQELYFLTSGPKSCGRNPVNVWRLKDNEFRHVLDLGHNVEVKKINQDTFFTMIDKKKELRSSEKMNEELKKFLSFSVDEDDTKIVWDDDRILTINKNVGKGYDNNTSFGRRVKEILNFKAGFFEREMFLYYDEEFSKDSIFIFNNDTTQKKMFQTVTAYRPSSFTILNFDGLVETLLVFVENRRTLRIYEYKGIQGFMYKDSIKMNVDKLFSFKIRKYSYMAKRYCLGLIHKNRLTILEALMYGEKLDMGPLTC